MDLARCLATVDRLCVRPFPAEHGWSDVGRQAPGYFLAEWADSTGRPRDEPLTEEDVEALRDALADRLDRRWPPEPRWGMGTLRIRAARDEPVPEPWASVSVLVDDVDLWRIPASGRWIALGVTRSRETDPARLVIAVTSVDPI
ncbi:hypothetical protein ACIQNG_04520 [Streptomyces sp. NPDC091377]|uniref:hypothetical protein n=1 Tax=unclassified Streptomyces TaxID=2593676 RepID=UPI0037F36B7C